MVIEVLSPGVQDGSKANLRAQMLLIRCDGGERLRCGGEQQAIDLRLVLVGDGADRRWQGEHDVEIGDRQEFGRSRRQPSFRRPPLAFWAMPVPTRIIGDARVGAVLAALDMTAERCRATYLNGRHDTALAQAHMPGIGRAPRLPVAAEDIRHLELRARHVRRLMPEAASRYSRPQADFLSVGLC